MSNKSFNNVIVSRTALQENYNTLKNKLGTNRSMLAMIKADAYGHGAVEVARSLAKVGCNIFGVGEVREAIILREAEITGEIFVMMGFEHEDAKLFFDHSLTPVIFSWADLVVLSSVAEQLSRNISIHLKVDTGMGRLGFRVEELIEIAKKANQLPGITVAGMVSHFPEADTPEAVSNMQAINLFSNLALKLKAEFSVSCHLVNSAGVLNFPDAYFDMGRVGISLYGYHPAGADVLSDLKLKQAMKFTTKVIQVKDFPIGVGVSYGHTYKTDKPTRLAVLPVGYEDGYSRAMSNKAEVLIDGKRAPVRGRICMNLCMVDVTDIGNVNVGDEVVLLGPQGNDNISADELGGWAGTISYEILCMFGYANNRKYID
ncbi:MAG: alanine racemase [Desulfotalea sp.]